MKTIAPLFLALALASPAVAQPDRFGPGPLIPEFGDVASVDADFAIPEDAEFRILFDVSGQADPGSINRIFNSAARFLNMHVAAGVDPGDIAIAIVVHGRASHDLLRAEVYAERQEGADNANAAAIATLREHGVRFILCGQTAAYYAIGNDDLLPGVEMALSAMTAHALLQQQGYTLNPF